MRRVHGQTRLPCSRYHLDAEDRVDADLEEVVVDADAAPAEQVCRDPGQDLLRRRCAGGRIRSTSRRLRIAAGGQRADRSSLPFGESGNASRKTYDDGTIGSGIRSCSQRLSSDVVGQESAAGHQIGNEPVLSAGIFRTTTTASLTPGCRASTASTSPSSTRKPRTFTWPSRRPSSSRTPSSHHRARSPVAYIRDPGSPCGSGTNRSAV